MTSCLDARENMCAYLDNELDDEERASFEEHIGNCEECRKELEEIKRIMELCNSLPQYELPEGFKDELHDKLVAAARKKPFFFNRAFASIAAGVILFFAAGTFARFVLNSPKADMEIAGTAEMAATEQSPALYSAESSNDVSLTFSEDENTDGADKKEGRDAAGFGSDTGSCGSNRSSTDKNRENAMMSDFSAETASNRMTFLTITTEDPNNIVERVKTIAVGNSGEESAGSLQPENAQMRAILQYKLPATNYETFVEELREAFGDDNVKSGPDVTEDQTDTLNKLIEQSETIDGRIRELQKEESKNAEEIRKLKDEKESLDSQIERIRLDSDLVTVTIYVNKK